MHIKILKCFSMEFEGTIPMGTNISINWNTGPENDISVFFSDLFGAIESVGILLKNIRLNPFQNFEKLVTADMEPTTIITSARTEQP